MASAEEEGESENKNNNEKIKIKNKKSKIEEGWGSTFHCWTMMLADWAVPLMVTTLSMKQMR